MPELLLQELRSEVPLCILDVRERPRIHAEGTLPGALSYSLDQLGGRIEELSTYRATHVVVVSQSGLRARHAALELAARGFNEVEVLEGGIDRWVELGYPTDPRPAGSSPG